MQLSRYWALSLKTTGFDPQKDVPLIIGVALCENGHVDPILAEEFFIKQSQPIAPEAKAEFSLTHELVRRIHHEGIAWNKFLKKYNELLGSDPVVVHHMDYIKTYAPALLENRDVIDHTRIAKHTWESGDVKNGFALETHKLWELKYWLNLNPDLMGADPTTCLAESLVLANVSAKTFEIQNNIGFDSLEKIKELQNTPLPVKVWPKGKKKGTPLHEIDLQSIQHELMNIQQQKESAENKKPIDHDLEYALCQELSRRAADFQVEAKKRSFFSRRV